MAIEVYWTLQEFMKAARKAFNGPYRRRGNLKEPERVNELPARRNQSGHPADLKLTPDGDTTQINEELNESLQPLIGNFEFMKLGDKDSNPE